MTCYLILNVAKLYGSFWNLFIYGTYWALIATFLTAFMGCVMMANHFEFDDYEILYKIYHICYTLMIFQNPSVFILYWGLEAKNQDEEIRTLYKDDKAMMQKALVQTWMVHALPTFFTLFMMPLSDCILIQRHSQNLIWFSVIYCFANFVGSKILGSPVYKVYDWSK